jgi:ribonuclease HI
VPVANEEQWRELVELAAPHAVTWRWVRGHAGHPRNEYANFLATRAAREQHDSGGLAPSGFLDWLAAERAKGRYTNFDPDD